MSTGQLPVRNSTPSWSAPAAPACARRCELARRRPERRGAVQGFPDALAHGCGAGRHRRAARQHDRGQLALAHVRHRQGLRLPRRPGRDRVHVPRRATRWSYELEHFGMPFDRNRERHDLPASVRRPHRRTSARSRCSAPAPRPTAPATRCCTRSTSATCARNTQFFVEWMALDLIRDAERRRARRGRAGDGNRRRDDPRRRRPTLLRHRRRRPHLRRVAPTPSSTPATASAWRRAPACRSKTWSSGSSTRPAWPAPAC